MDQTLRSAHIHPTELEVGRDPFAPAQTRRSWRGLMRERTTRRTKGTMQQFKTSLSRGTMKRQTLTLLLAALAFALPCLAQTNFTFCHTYEARSARVFYSEVFSIAKGDTSWVGLMRGAFEKHIKANYDHIEKIG